MPGDLKTVNALLKSTTDRLQKEEEKDNPDMRNVLFSLSTITTAAIGVASSIEDLYKKVFDLEKSHDQRLLNLSKKIIYLSASVSIGGGVIVLLGKYLMGIILK